MKTDFNLDDENEVKDFIAKYGTMKGRALANRLGLKGRGAVKRANSLSNYAWNKQTAMNQRGYGNTREAIYYEGICDSIYKKMDPRDKW